METTSSKESAQKLAVDGNIIKCGLQLYEDNSAKVRHEPCLASCRPETNLRRHSTTNVGDYKILKLHEINDLEASGNSEIPSDCVIDLSTSATRFHIQDRSLTDQTDSESKPLECGSNYKKRNSEHSSIPFRRYEEISKPHECETCTKRFRTRFELKQHERVHTGEKPYQCKTCGKNFRFPTNLMTHQRVHTGERPFKCEMCPKGFVKKTDLKRHVLTHTGVKRFECEICHRKFARKGTLTKHGRVHKNE